MNPHLRQYGVDTTLRTYLNRIGETPLLTIAEEVALAKRIKQGDDAARQHMIRANLRLVAKIAYDFVNLGLPLEDLVAEGNIGLMKAVDRFDPSKGGKLSTYAAWWIKQCIRRALNNQCRTIRLPVHLTDKLAKLRRIEIGISEELGREPTTEELAELTGIESRNLNALKEAAKFTASLDAPLGDGLDHGTLSDVVADESVSTPDIALCKEDLVEKLKPLLVELTARERSIIQQRYGLGGAKQKTLAEVGAQLGVTRERIRQVQNAALIKLRRALNRLEEPGRQALLKNHAEDDDDLPFFGSN